ncbi:MAG TPA: VOC family protein [Terriglobia bacterium]|jgi:catechol 2,3-dioxygenase-like lactoylglutathione lyase family enzyme|nr:VOC family protein [Terriglobia bacterium]
MKPEITAIDHVQVAAPQGCEIAAREFYGFVLGLEEIEKPLPLQARGGCWFRCGAQQLHVGLERDFQPARKAHPAFRVTGLDALRERLRSQQIKIIDDDTLPGLRRFYADDPWGNRLEFVEAAD